MKNDDDDDGDDDDGDDDNDDDDGDGDDADDADDADDFDDFDVLGLADKCRNFSWWTLWMAGSGCLMASCSPAQDFKRQLRRSLKGQGWGSSLETMDEYVGTGAIGHPNTGWEINAWAWLRLECQTK